MGAKLTQKLREQVTTRVPDRSLMSARGAAVGAAAGAVFGPLSAAVFGGLGAYLGVLKSRVNHQPEPDPASD